MGVKMKSFRTRRYPLAFAAVFILAASTVRAENPFDYLFFPFQQVDADPAKRYSVTEDQGPWMVMAQTE